MARKTGSADDQIGVTGSYGIVRNGEGPPRPDPGAAPRLGERIQDALRRQAREQSEAQTPVTKTSRDHLLEVALGANATAPLPPDPELKPARPVSIQPIILSGATLAFGEREQNLFFSGDDAAIAAVSHIVGEALRVERVDLSGHSLNTVLMPAALSCVDLSQDGKLLLTQNVPEGLEGPERLDAWNIEGASPRHLISFKPYDELTGGGRGIARARFLPGDHIATLNPEGRLVVWDFKANAVWAAMTERGRRFFLSPGRKHIAVLADPSALILDALTGKTLKRVGDLPVGRKDGIQGEITLCFKPDGKELAVGARGYLSTYDLTSGAPTRELYPAISEEVPVFGQANLGYCSEGYVLAPGEYVKGEQLLVGLKQQIVVWRYMPDKFHGLGPNGIFNGRYWYTAPPPLGSKGKPTLLSVVLPDDAVRTALSKVMCGVPPIEVIGAYVEEFAIGVIGQDDAGFVLFFNDRLGYWHLARAGIVGAGYDTEVEGFRGKEDWRGWKQWVTADNLVEGVTLDQYLSSERPADPDSDDVSRIALRKPPLEALMQPGDEWWRWVSGTEPLMQEGGLALIRRGRVVWARQDWIS